MVRAEANQVSGLRELVELDSSQCRRKRQCGNRAGENGTGLSSRLRGSPRLTPNATASWGCMSSLCPCWFTLFSSLPIAGGLRIRIASLGSHVF